MVCCVRSEVLSDCADRRTHERARGGWSVEGILKHLNLKP